jgi:hypothetical protein
MKWFGKCDACDILKALLAEERKINKDLLDRLMSFNQDAFNRYQAEVKPKTPLYPSAIDESGKEIVYNDSAEKQADEAWKLLSGEPINVDEFPEEAAKKAQDER